MAEIDVEIDELTNSIKNAISGDSFDTEVLPFEKTDLKKHKKADWVFDWAKEVKQGDRQVFKLVIVGNTNIVQGLLSITDKNDHIFVNLVEKAKFNRGKKKLYLGIGGNLFAFACKVAFDKGYEGGVAFFAKTRLIKHYEDTLGAERLGGLRMAIDTDAATKLVNQYFKQ
jgi:hypothetical protein